MTFSGARLMAVVAAASLIPLTPATSASLATGAPDPVPAGIDVFALHSNPGATRTLYLDFDGHHLEGTGYNATGHGYNLPPIDAPPFDFDEDPGTFSSLERDHVYNTWQVVAEDYAPLDVDVTTQEPTWRAMNRTSDHDQRFGSWLIITPDTAGNDIKWATCRSVTCAGYSEIGYVDSTYNGFRHAFRFVPKQTRVLPRALGNVASHELGHTLGLTHDTRAEYEDWLGWGPIMGPDLSHPYTVFSAGEYQGGSSKEDDFAVMAANGMPLRTDDHGDTAVEAADPLPRGSTVSGIITTRTDKDVFRVEHTCDGALTLAEHGAQPAGNLDAQLRLLDAEGRELGREDPPMDFAPDDFHSNLGLDATLSMIRPAGTYYVEVAGVGVQTGSDGTLPTDYGSVGRYTLTHSSACAGAQVPGEVSSLTAVSSVDGTGVQLSWAAPATDGGSAVTGYAVQRPDGSVLPVGKVLTHTVSGLAPGTAGAFRVRAVNAVGGGALSQISATTTATPSPPTSAAAASSSDTSIHVSWQANDDDGGSPITSFVVIADGAEHLLPASATSWDHANLGPGTRHNYSVHAVNAVGRSLALTTEATTSGVAQPPPPPAPPITVPGGARIGTSSSGAAGGRSSATARWRAPVTTGGTPLTAYRVTALRLRPSGAVLSRRVFTAAASKRALVMALPQGRYRFVVVAVNAVGASAPSARSNAVRAR